MGSSGSENKIEENLKWREFDTEITDLSSVKHNVK
jgi:hypothetical protein